MTNGFGPSIDDLDLEGAAISSAGWLEGMRDFQLDLVDGRSVLFEECLQAGLFLPPGPPELPTIGAWWSDEPSPLLQSLPIEVRLRYQHLVFEVGEGILRVACRSVSIDDGER